MKTQWQVLNSTDGRIIKTYDTEQEAIDKLEKGPPADLMGTVYWTLRKIWTNKK